MSVTLTDIRQAAERIRPYAHRTPVLTCESLDRQVGARVYLKCENLSSGNHAQALALAARLRGIPAYIVMPENAPAVKKAAVAGYGGRITFCAPTLEARERTLEQVRAGSEAEVVHPYNDERVIAGQGTAALELLEEVPDLDAIIAPVGGGGLLGGTALAGKGLSPRIRVLAGEPEKADDAYRSLQAGRILPSVNPHTMADGLLTSLGERTFPILRAHVEQIVTVSEAGIAAAMRFVWERAKIVIEPSAAVHPLPAKCYGRLANLP